jgi:hypothetical protein
MKRTTFIAFGLLLIMAGCTKNNITQLGDITTGTQIKLIHAAPGVPALDGFVNSKKVSATTVYSVTDNGIVTSLTTGFPYLSVFPGSNYLSVASGTTSVQFVASTPVPALISEQSIPVSTVIGNISQPTVDGSAYSVFAMGLPGSATTALTAKIVEDKFPAPVANKAFIRFAHMIPNGAALDLAVTYTLTGGTATTQTITTATTYSNVTDFIPVDVNSSSTTNFVFQMYLAGTTTKFGTVTAAIPVAPGRYYTLVGRGLASDYAVPGTTIVLKATARPTLPVTDPATKFPEIYFNPAGLTYYTNK